MRIFRNPLVNLKFAIITHNEVYIPYRLYLSRTRKSWWKVVQNVRMPIFIVTEWLHKRLAITRPIFKNKSWFHCVTFMMWFSKKSIKLGFACICFLPFWWFVFRYFSTLGAFVWCRQSHLHSVQNVFTTTTARTNNRTERARVHDDTNASLQAPRLLHLGND